MVAAFFFARTVIMAFTIRDLSVLAYANGFTLWHYKAGMDSLADVACDDYFADASDMMAAGDMILISAPKHAGCCASRSPRRAMCDRRRQLSVCLSLPRMRGALPAPHRCGAERAALHISIGRFSHNETMSEYRWRPQSQEFHLDAPGRDTDSAQGAAVPRLSSAGDLIE